MTDQDVPVDNDLVEWLAHGERGVSSETMVTELTGVYALRSSWGSPPSDPSDFKRCEKLLRQVPSLRPALGRMAEVSKEWARLVSRWYDIVGTLEEEIPGIFDDPDVRGSAPRTYELMKEIMRPPAQPEPVASEPTKQDEQTKSVEQLIAFATLYPDDWERYKALHPREIERARLTLHKEAPAPKSQLTDEEELWDIIRKASPCSVCPRKYGGGDCNKCTIWDAWDKLGGYVLEHLTVGGEPAAPPPPLPLSPLPLSDDYTYTYKDAKCSIGRLLDHTNMAKHQQTMHPHNDVVLLDNFMARREATIERLTRKLEEALALSCENTRGEGCCPLSSRHTEDDKLNAAVVEAAKQVDACHDSVRNYPNDTAAWRELAKAHDRLKEKLAALTR